MIDITKLNHSHIGRLVIDKNKRIGTIVSIGRSYLSVDYDGFLSIGSVPGNLEFFDFIGGLTIEDIGSKWMSRNRNIFTFVGGEFSQTYNIEYLIFRHELVNREMRYTAMPKSLTRIKEAPTESTGSEVPPELNDLVRAAHKAACQAGYYKIQTPIPQLLMLIVSEVSEAMEAHRKGEYVNISGSKLSENDSLLFTSVPMSDNVFKKYYEENIKGAFEEEMADIAIRLFYLCGFMDIDLYEHVQAKMKYNAIRGRDEEKKY